MKNAAGFIYGPMPHYIDHLAPLCHLLDIPLIVTDEEIKDSAERFYPHLRVTLVNYIATPEFLVQNFTHLFVCTPRILFDEICFFAQKLNNKHIHTIWCPHGNSDKGHVSASMQTLNKETSALVYGQKMIDFLKEKEAFSQLKRYCKTSNFRKAYYLENQQFYDEMTQRLLEKKFEKNAKTVFYAPTWQDAESSSSFYEALPSIIDNLPANWNLLVKPHPNLMANSNSKTQKLIDFYFAKKNVHFIVDFPPIHPLLAASDIYIGDMSSIGYDFLSYNKPMFFLNQQKRDKKTDSGLYLYRCGVEVTPEQYKDLYTIIQEELPYDDTLFSCIRKEVDLYTFGEAISLEELKKTIISLCKTFPEPDLNFF